MCACPKAETEYVLRVSDKHVEKRFRCRHRGKKTVLSSLKESTEAEPRGKQEPGRLSPKSFLGTGEVDRGKERALISKPLIDLCFSSQAALTFLSSVLFHLDTGASQSCRLLALQPQGPGEGVPLLLLLLFPGARSAPTPGKDTPDCRHIWGQRVGTASQGGRGRGEQLSCGEALFLNV